MKYYVLCKECGAKIHINTTAKTRYELPRYFQLSCYQGHTKQYFPHEVWAIAGAPSATSGLIIGGLLGAAIGGSLGAVSGAIILAGAGANYDEKERKAVEEFNKS